MANISVPNSFTDGTSADPTLVNENFDSLINGLSDGNVDISIDTIDLNGSLIVTGDAYELAWQDYSGISTIVGWGSFTTKLIFRKTVGRLTYVMWNISGTSNSTSTTITSGYTSANDIDVRVITNYAKDNSVELVASGILVAKNSTVITMYKKEGSSWTNSGTKTVQGQIVFQNSL